MHWNKSLHKQRTSLIKSKCVKSKSQSTAIIACTFFAHVNMYCIWVSVYVCVYLLDMELAGTGLSVFKQTFGDRREPHACCSSLRRDRRATDRKNSFISGIFRLNINISQLSWLVSLLIHIQVNDVFIMILFTQGLKSILAEHQHKLHQVLEEGKCLLQSVACHSLENQLAVLGDHWLTNTNIVNKELQHLESVLIHWTRFGPSIF